MRLSCFLLLTFVVGIQSQWANPVSGNFATAENWIGSIPTTTAVISAIGEAFTVTGTI